jgi:hypothetical protein
MTAAAWRLEPHSPRVFIGAPPLLVADLQLHNPSNRHIHPGPATAKLPDEAHERSVRIPGRLPPETTSRLRAQLLVSRSMAPGIYRASMRAADGSHPIELRVLERRCISIKPQSVEFVAEAGKGVSADLYLENRGNVPVALNDTGSVFFEEVDWLGRALVFAMREVGEDESFDRYRDRVYHELRSTMQHKTSVSIDVKTKTLAPDAATDARISMTLPTGLYKGRNYAAFFDFAGVRLRLGISCTGGTASPKRRPR